MPIATLINPVPAPNAEFGASVAISGTRVVVGSPRDDTGATDAGSAYVYDLASGTPTVPAITLNNPSPADGDYFGRSVAIDGTRVVVGAFSDNTGADDAGSAYVYDLTSGSPTVPVTTLNNPSPVSEDSFGLSVAISGTRVVCGTPFNDTGAIAAGSAYVYDLTNATPTVPVVTLSNPDPDDFDYFGKSVAIDGTRVVVGAENDDAGAVDAGSAYVYNLTSVTPAVPVTTLNNPVPAPDDEFGASVAISGTRVVCGTPGDDTGANNAGSAYVYDLAGGTPTVPVATLNNPGPSERDEFGTAVAVSGTRVVVGAPYDDIGAINAGAAYVYDLASGSPTVPAFTLPNPSPSPAFQSFGLSVAISGTLVVVGCPDDAAGSVYVYDLASGTPTVPAITLNNPSPAANDDFGYAVAIFGTRVVVGTPQDSTGAARDGSAYVYDLASATPTVPVTTLNNPSPADGDRFGLSVAVSGMRVVVGAPADDSGANDAGSAYVYDLAGGTPTVPVATLNNPGPQNNENFGRSVAISGARVVIGTPYNYDPSEGIDAGAAYVYDLTSATPTVPVTTLQKPSPAATDSFGWSVAISGTRVVAGATRESTGASAAGSAYVYDLASGTPTVPVATLNNPSPAANDDFGYAVAIDGFAAVIGARFDDPVTRNKGSAYVYAPGPSLVVTLATDTVDAFDGQTSLREAMAYAATLSGPQTITFAPALAGQTLTLGSGWNGAADDTALRVNSGNVSIAGPAGGVTLAVAGGSARRHLYVAGGATATIANLTLTGGSPANPGGAAYNDGTLGVSNCTFANNSAGEGGAIQSVGTLTITGSTFSNNVSSFNGGALRLFGTETISGCTFSGNTVANEGGALISFGNLTVANCTFTDNGKNAVVLWDGTADLRHVTVAYNRNGGLVRAFAAVTLRNSIVAGNSGFDVFGTLAAGSSNNLLEISAAAAGLGTLASNGGPTATIALLAGSPAINAGSATGASATDQRGFPIIGVPDIGAYEYNQATANYDSDTDGFTDAEEYIADTQPANAASFFPKTVLTNAPAGQMSLLIDQTSTGRVYGVYINTNLLQSPQTWTLIPPEQTGNAASLTLTITNSLPAANYRTGVRLP